ncbi:MAG: hypothetical protein Q7S19_04085 [bacterium]|nr:hypothetical protein [bacterium]
MNSYIEKYNTEDIQRYLSVVLVFSAIALSLFYIYLINSSILNTMSREQNNRQIAEVSAKLSGLENSYMARKSDLNIDMARTLGFKDDFSKVHFSSESPNVAGNLSLLGDEI